MLLGSQGSCLTGGGFLMAEDKVLHKDVASQEIPHEWSMQKDEKHTHKEREEYLHP